MRETDADGCNMKNKTEGNLVFYGRQRGLLEQKFLSKGGLMRISVCVDAWMLIDQIRKLHPENYNIYFTQGRGIVETYFLIAESILFCLIIRARSQNLCRRVFDESKICLRRSRARKKAFPLELLQDACLSIQWYLFRFYASGHIEWRSKWRSKVLFCLPNCIMSLGF